MKKKNLLFSTLTTALAIIISLLIAIVIIVIVSDNPGKAFHAFIFGPFKSKRMIGSILTTAIPITFTGLAVCVMFQASMFNMCAEGGFFLGALSAAGVAACVELPGILGLIIPMLAGTITGMILAFIPAVLKAKLGASEMVSSLMLNYVALYLGLYVLNYHLRDQSFGALATKVLPENSIIPIMISKTSVHYGIVLAIIAIVICYLFIYKTKTGHRIRVMGQNSKFAKYAGINVAGVIIISQIIGGGLAGLGGAVEVMGMYNRFQWTSLPGYGWDGITLAILARNKPQFIPIAAIFLAYIRVGASTMASGSNVPKELITVIQAIMILLVTASALLDGIKKRMIVKEAMKNGSAS